MTARHVDLSRPRPDLTNQPLPELVTVCIRHVATIADRVPPEGTSLAVRLLIGGGLAFYMSGTKGMEDNPLDRENEKTTEVAKPYDNGLLMQLGPRVYVGYAFW